jgi:NADPH-dependent ferric siderophore reductase
MPQFYLIPSAARPHVRNYTVRAFRPESNEIDIEFVAHGDDSPASYWAGHAQPGDEVGLLSEGKQYLPPEDAAWQLLVADESGVPAILSIIEQAPAELRAEVYLEVPSTADIRPVSHGSGITVRWLPRDIPGRLALETVSAVTLPDGDSYSFIIGESGLATGLRRHLVSERGFAKPGVTFVGYWKHGRASLG